MKAFNEIYNELCTALQKMQDSNDYKESGELFVQKLQALGEDASFKPACEEARAAKENSVILLGQKLLDLSNKFLSLIPQMQATLQGRAFLEAHFNIIRKTILKLPSLSPILIRGGNKGKWEKISQNLNYYARNYPEKTEKSQLLTEGLALCANAFTLPSESRAQLKSCLEAFASNELMTAEVPEITKILSDFEALLAIKGIEGSSEFQKLFSETLCEQLDNILTNLIMKADDLSVHDFTAFHTRLSNIIQHPVFVHFKQSNKLSTETIERTLNEGSARCVKLETARQSFPHSCSLDLEIKAQREENKDRKDNEEVLNRLRNGVMQDILEFIKKAEWQSSREPIPKEALLMILVKIREAYNRYQNTFDSKYKEAYKNAREEDQKPWLEVRHDIQSHLGSSVRILLTTIANRFEEFDFSDVSQLCGHFSEFRIMPMVLLPKLQRFLAQFDIKQLEKACFTTSMAALQDVTGFSIKVGKSRTNVKHNSSNTGLSAVTQDQDYPSPNEVANVTEFLLRMRFDHPEMILKMMHLAAISISKATKDLDFISHSTSVGKIAHSLGMLIYYLNNNHGNVKEVVGKLCDAIFCYGKKATKQAVKKHLEPVDRAYGDYCSGFRVLGEFTKQYVSTTNYDGFLREVLEDEILEKTRNCIPKNYSFAGEVARILKQIHGLNKKEEAGRTTSNGRTGDNRISLRSEELISPFHYDFLLRMQDYWYSIEANGKAYHYLIAVYQDETPPCFDHLDGKSWFKTMYVHGFHLPGENEEEQVLIGVDIHQTEFERQLKLGDKFACTYLSNLCDERRRLFETDKRPGELYQARLFDQLRLLRRGNSDLKLGENTCFTLCGCERNAELEHIMTEFDSKRSAERASQSQGQGQATGILFSQQARNMASMTISPASQQNRLVSITAVQDADTSDDQDDDENDDALVVKKNDKQGHGV